MGPQCLPFGWVHRNPFYARDTGPVAENPKNEDPPWSHGGSPLGPSWYLGTLFFIFYAGIPMVHRYPRSIDNDPTSETVPKGPRAQ